MHITSDLYPRKCSRNQTTHDAYILANRGVCTALIALDLHVTERWVIGRQRKLGIRKLTGNKRKGERHEAKML